MYRSKLFNIVLNHRFSYLDCADQYVVQMCPELTKFLPLYILELLDPKVLTDSLNFLSYV